MPDDGDDLTLAACARSLSAAGDKITRQALSKYCDEHGLKRQTPRGPRVSFAAVQAHRAKNYRREVMTGGRRIPAAKPVPAEVPADSGTADVIDMSPARRAQEARAESLELENARKRGELVAVDEVTAATADMVASLRQGLFQATTGAANTLAAELRVSAEEERLIRAAMKRMVREGLSRFVDQAAQANADMTHDAPRETRTRLAALTLMAARLKRRPERYLSAMRERFG